MADNQLLLLMALEFQLHLDIVAQNLFHVCYGSTDPKIELL